jgi:hypothetical protein
LRLSLPRPNYSHVVSTTALVAALGGGAIAVSQAQGPTTEIAICLKTKGKAKGTVRQLTKVSAKCKKGEKKLRWNIQGLAGARGPAGPVGAAGAAGAAGIGGGSAAAPAGQVAYFDLANCPAGWSEYVPGRGRYVTGVNPGGTRGGTAGTALSNLEDRPTGQHAHSVQDPGHTHAVQIKGDRLTVPGNNAIAGNNGTSNITLAGDASTDTPAAGIIRGVTGISVNAAGDVAGTNAPYVQLLACRKD